MKLKISNGMTKLAAGISSYVMAANAYAQGAGGGGTGGASVGTMATAVAGSVWQVSDMISTASYVVGAGMGMAGLIQLKKHAESPGNVSINAGLGRLAVGAGLVGLPFVVNTAFNTMGVTDQSTGTGITGSSTNRFDE